MDEWSRMIAYILNDIMTIPEVSLSLFGRLDYRIPSPLSQLQ